MVDAVPAGELHYRQASHGAAPARSPSRGRRTLRLYPRSSPHPRQPTQAERGRAHTRHGGRGFGAAPVASAGGSERPGGCPESAWRPKGSGSGRGQEEEEEEEEEGAEGRRLVRGRRRRARRRLGRSRCRCEGSGAAGRAVPGAAGREGGGEGLQVEREAAGPEPAVRREEGGAEGGGCPRGGTCSEILRLLEPLCALRDFLRAGPCQIFAQSSIGGFARVTASLQCVFCVFSAPGHPGARQGKCGPLKDPRPSSVSSRPGSALRFSATSLTAMRPSTTGSRWVAAALAALHSFTEQLRLEGSSMPTQCHPWPWAGLPPTSSGCPGPHPTWP